MRVDFQWEKVEMGTYLDEDWKSYWNKSEEISGGISHLVAVEVARCSWILEIFLKKSQQDFKV